MDMLEKAIGLALQAHAGQVDKSGMLYILHPLRLMVQMETEHEMIAALLHDVLEDSDVSLADLIQMGIPAAVLDALTLLTHDSKDIPYLEYILSIRSNPIARKVKLADLVHNMEVRRLPGPLSAADCERLDKYLSAWRVLAERQEHFPE